MQHNVLTFDTDWCSDEVLQYTLDMLANRGEYKCVVYLTNRLEEATMNRLISNKNIQIGIHPNINNISDAAALIEEMRIQIPEASSHRSHGLRWWPELARILHSQGINYDSSVIAPLQASLVPCQVHGIIQFPIFWGDSYHMSNGFSMDSFSKIMDKAAKLRVFNFHPIHIFANTHNIEEWKKMKVVLSDAQKMNLLVKDFSSVQSPGIRNFFEILLDSIKPEQTYTFADLEGLIEQ